MQVSLFGSAKSKRSSAVEIIQLFDLIKNGAYRDKIEAVRRAGSKEEATKLKASTLPAIAPAGLFQGGHAKTNLVQYSRLVVLDFDALTAEQLQVLRSTVETIDYTFACFISPSGNGLKVFVFVSTTDVSHHGAAWKAVKGYYENATGLKVDESGKDVSRLCFVSYDPGLYLNELAEVFQVEIEQPQAITGNASITEEQKKEILEHLEEIESREVDITEGYHNWRNIGFVFADMFNEDGRELFHRVSRYNAEYDSSQTDQQFTACLHSKGKGITPKTFFDLCHKAGVYGSAAAAFEDIDTEAPSVKSLRDFEHLRITAEKDYPNNEPVIIWDGGGIAAPGNLTALSAQAKTGKTAFCNMLMAGTLSIDGNVNLFGGIEIIPNIQTKAVINFDTEQAEADQQHNVKTVLRRLGVTNTPDNFLAYNIRQLSISEYREVTDSICHAAAAQFGGIYAIFIDGAADYIKDVNSTEQATEIREYFTHLAIRYQCPVILVIHQNPGSTKERGHLGSEIQRKCYCIINITKEDEISIAKTSFSRKAGDLQPIHFKYSIATGYHIEVDPPSNNMQAAKLEKIKAVINDALPPLAAYSYSELENKVIAATLCSESTFKRNLKIAMANNWIFKGEDGKYRHRVQGSRGFTQGSSGR